MTNIEELPKPEVTLIGEDGNAFAIIGACTKALRRAGWNTDQVGVFQEEAMSGDYNKVLQIAMKYLDVS